MISDEPIVKKMAWTSGTRRTSTSMETHREYIVEIPDYVPPFDPAVRTASFGEQIVRCRDCKLAEEGKGIYADAWFCHHFSMTDRAGFPVRPSWKSLKQSTRAVNRSFTTERKSWESRLTDGN